MSHNSQVISQAAIYSQFISQVVIDLADDYTSAAADRATAAILDARQAMLLLEMVLTEASQIQIERQRLPAVEVAYVDLELFIERLQIALDLLKPQDVAESFSS